MHARIWQVSTKPVEDDERLSESSFYDNTGDFADYVSDMTRTEEEEDIKDWLPRILKGLFVCNGRELTFVGSKEFIQEWRKAIKESVEILDDSNMLVFPNLYKVERVVKETHMRVGHRFAFDSSLPEEYGDFVRDAYNNLAPGDKIYVGAVIDFHY